MRLTEYTDYTLRVLMCCAARPQQLVTISELADPHGVSGNHLMKIVTDLGRMGMLEAIRGHGGGLRLLRDPAQIRFGDVVRAWETDFRLVECFDPTTSRCTLTPSCRLKGVFDAALRAYFKELDGVTLADIVEPSSAPGSGRTVSLRRRNGASPAASPNSLRKTHRTGTSDA